MISFPPCEVVFEQILDSTCNIGSASVMAPMNSALASSTGRSPLTGLLCFFYQQGWQRVHSTVLFCRLLHTNLSISVLHDLQDDFGDFTADSAFDFLYVERPAAIGPLLMASNVMVSSRVLLSRSDQPRTSFLTSSSARPEITTSLTMMSVKSLTCVHPCPEHAIEYEQVAAFPLTFA